MTTRRTHESDRDLDARDADQTGAAAERATDRLLYQSAVRATSEGIVVHAPDGSIRMANPSAEKILGLTLDQLTGRSAVDPRWQLVRADGSALPPAEIP